MKLYYDKRLKKNTYRYTLKDLSRPQIVHDGGSDTVVTPSGGGSGTTSFVDNGATLALVQLNGVYKIIGSDDISSYLSQGYTLVMQSDNIAKLNSMIPSGTVAQTTTPASDTNNYLPYIIIGAIVLILVS